MHTLRRPGSPTIASPTPSLAGHARRGLLMALAALAAAGTAARASDEGISGGRSVGSGKTMFAVGGYGLTLPIDLPPPSGDLPLAFTYAQPRTRGPLGISWQMPLSYVSLHSQLDREQADWREARRGGRSR